MSKIWATGHFRSTHNVVWPAEPCLKIAQLEQKLKNVISKAS